MTGLLSADARRYCRDNIFGLAVLLLTVAIAIAWQCSTPVHSDDYPYQRMADADDGEVFWGYQGEPITQFSQVPEAAVNHWRTVNGRGSNIAYIAVQPLPLWLIKLSGGLLIAALSLMLVRAAGRPRNVLCNPLAMIVLTIMLWTGLRWNEQMQSTDFVYNYVAPSVLMLGVLVLFLDRDKRPGPWAWVLAVVFALWHETFTITFGVFVGIQWLLTRRHYLLALLAILVAGALVQYSPGTGSRVTSHLSVQAENLQYYPYTMMISSMWPSWVAIGWWLIRRRKLEDDRRRELDRFAAGLIAVSLVCIAIILLLNAPMRAHWGADILAIVLCSRLSMTYRTIRMAWYIKVIALCLYAAWGASLVYWQLRTTRFTQYLACQLQKGNNVIADASHFFDADIPFWIMDMTPLQYGSYYAQWTFAECNSNHKFENFLIVEPQYAGQPFDSWPKVPGRNDLRYAAGNVLVRKASDASILNERVDVHFGDATLSVSPIDLAISTVHKDKHAQMYILNEFPIVYMGDTLVFVDPEQTPRSLAHRPIVRIDYPEHIPTSQEL